MNYDENLELRDINISLIYDINHLNDRVNENLILEEKGTSFIQSLVTLANSIKKHGLTNPIHIYELEEDDSLREKGYEFRIIVGARRIKAYQLLGRDSISAFIHKDKKKSVMITISENTNRKNLMEIDSIEALFKAIPFYFDSIEEEAYTKNHESLLKTGKNIFSQFYSLDKRLKDNLSLRAEHIDTINMFEKFLEDFNISYSTLYRKKILLEQESIVIELFLKKIISQNSISKLNKIKRNCKEDYLNIVKKIEEQYKENINFDKPRLKEIISSLIPRDSVLKSDDIQKVKKVISGKYKLTVESQKEVDYAISLILKVYDEKS